MRYLSVDNVHKGVSALSGIAILTGCSGPQSTLDPAGYEAHQVADLFWAMLLGGGMIWVIVVGLTIYATKVNPKRHGEGVGKGLIIGGGVVLPSIVLAILLITGLALMPDLRAGGEGLRLKVSGEQWWWRVHYLPEDGGEPIETANEIRLPVGERIELELSSPDVIHSFWIPSLAGKLDLIPGRTNRLVLEPTEIGTFRGVCAEFCGASHALMAFSVVVMSKEAFKAWLAKEAAPADEFDHPLLSDGQRLFIETGCGACHAIRGTSAAGKLGPDLTHVGGRETLGAGTLPNNAGTLAGWIANVQTLKPDARMPSFGILNGDELRAIAAYLDHLE